MASDEDTPHKLDKFDWAAASQAVAMVESKNVCEHVCLGMRRYGERLPPAQAVREEIYKRASSKSQCARTIVRNVDGGATTCGYELFRNGCGRIGTMIAANSGRPAGACGQRGQIVPGQIHPHHTTQEEDIVSCWLTAQGGRTRADQNRLYCETIDQKWGLIELNSTSRRTLQGVDYGSATHPESFADAWVVPDAMLCAKVQHPARFDTERTFPSALVFSAGPNAGCRKSAKGSTARTVCNLALRDYSFFRACVKEAIRTGLDAMVRVNCDVALIARVSCGIYAGPHRKRIGTEFVAICDELLNEKVRPGSELRRGHYFGSVIIPDLLSA